VPLLEEALLFRIEVRAADVLLRTAEVSQVNWTYTAVMQAEDGASLSGLGFRVVQVSPGFGDGVAAEVYV
jgi:hypothetical protein